MSPVILTRAQQRRMQKLADQVDRICAADRKFFERFPQRQHRVRFASKAEIEQHEIVDGKPVWIPPGCSVFTVVRNAAPGVRLRAFLRRLSNSETDVGESTARSIFEAAATPRTWEIEAQLRRAAEVRT